MLLIQTINGDIKSNGFIIEVPFLKTIALSFIQLHIFEI